MRPTLQIFRRRKADNAVTDQLARSTALGHHSFMRLSSCVACLLLCAFGLHAQPNRPDGLYAEIETPHGSVVASLAFHLAPLTVANFVGLAEGTLGPTPGQPYFDDLTFHRVVSGFVIQGGDPWANGEGGPGYEFPDEFSSSLKHDKAGVLSMANSGPDTNGSQFFITLSAVPRLDYLHSVFGQIIEGLDVLDLIESKDVMRVRIIRQGPAATAFAADQIAFDALIAAAPQAHPPHLDDPDALLPATPTYWPRILNHKLANFERFTGQKIYLQLLDTLGPDWPPAPSTAKSHHLAHRARLLHEGIAGVYAADTDIWQLTIGHRTAQKLQLSGETLAETKTRLLASASITTEAELSARYGEREPPRNRHVMAHLQALMNEFITALEPQS